LTPLDAQLNRNILASPYRALPKPVVDANPNIPPIWRHQFDAIMSSYGLVFVGLGYNYRQSLVFSFRTNLRVMSLPVALSFLLGSWEPSLVTEYEMCESVWVGWQTKVSFVARDGVGYVWN
jgi:hypothetical protein